MIQKAYKIVELGPRGQIRTLFHGAFGTRDLAMGVWQSANLKWVCDGSGNNWYWSGWHVLPTLEDCRAYASRFRNRRDKLRIIECEISVQIRPKEHSTSPVLLAQKLRPLAIIERI